MKRVWPLMLVLAACEGTPPLIEPLPPVLANRVAPRLATMAYIVAVADQGRGFFDNFFPCMRGGALRSVDSPEGRRVGFIGCNLGDSIVVSGEGNIVWVGPGLADTRGLFCPSGDPPVCEDAFRFEGNLTITVDGQTYDVATFAASAIVPAARDSNDLPRLRSLAATLEGTFVELTDSTLRDRYFDTSGFTVDSRPNAGQSLSALEVPDLARLSWSLANILAWTQLDETLESARGNHAHTLGCGTFQVTYNAQQLPTIAYDFTGCNLAGVIVQGDFTAVWGEFNPDGGVIRLDLSGGFVLGGAVPKVSVTTLTWRAANIVPLPGTAVLSLQLSGPGGPVTWTVNAPVDD